nr:DinB family protein [Gymnodinialimonas phycosphaerae]
MIGPDYARHMARYNAWQNQWMFQAADALSQEQRDADRGAFWGSIQGTLSHLMWGDTLWISRFDGGEGPVSALVGSDTATAYDWPALMAGRPQLDARIAAWAWSTDDSDFEGDLTWYSGSLKRDMTMSRAICVMQIFNHQTHHRGQVHQMLTSLGVTPTDTDIPFMPAEVPEWI